MLNYLIRRLGYGLLILIGVNLFTFFLFFSVNTPDDMARLNIGGKRVTQDQIEKWKTERGYDKPVYWDASVQGTAKLTHTIVWERSVSLFALDFGRSDSQNAVDIGHEIKTRMGVSLQLAVPIFILQVFASTAFALLLVFFRHSRIDFWGVVLCVVMLSISSLFYIIVGQVFFSRMLSLNIDHGMRVSSIRSCRTKSRADHSTIASEAKWSAFSPWVCRLSRPCGIS